MNVDALGEPGIGSDRIAESELRELQHVRQCDIRQRIGTRAGNATGQVCDATVQHVVDHIRRIGVSRRAGSLDATSLVDRNVDDD